VVIIVAVVITTTTIIFTIVSTLFLSSVQITQQVQLQCYMTHQEMMGPATKLTVDFSKHHLNNYLTEKGNPCLSFLCRAMDLKTKVMEI
jgi:hypothetical protein